MKTNRICIRNPKNTKLTLPPSISPYCTVHYLKYLLSLKSSVCSCNSLFHWGHRIHSVHRHRCTRVLFCTLLPCEKQSQEDSSENTILNVKFIFLERKNPQGFHCSPNSVIPNVNHYSLVVTCYPNPVITILSNCSPCYALLVILYCHPSDNNVFIPSLSSNSSVIEVLSFQSYLTHLSI